MLLLPVPIKHHPFTSVMPRTIHLSTIEFKVCVLGAFDGFGIGYIKIIVIYVIIIYRYIRYADP
jgi:hypothetical protein